MIDMPPAAHGSMGFERRIAGTTGALLRAFPGENEGLALEKAILIADRRRKHIDLERRAAPAHPKIGRDLREQAASAQWPGPARNARTLGECRT